MEMPKPGQAHRKFETLVGSWEGGETLHPSPWDPAGGTATASVTNRWILDGFAVVQQYEQRRDGKVTFSGHGVFWYDPRRDEYVMHWWDSMGGTSGEYRGRFEGDRLVLGAPMPQGGHSRTSWTPTGPEAHTFLMEVSPDGETWHPAMEGRYRRAPRKVGRPGAPKAAPKKTAAKRVAARKATARGATVNPRKAAAKTSSKGRAKKAARSVRKAANTRSRR